MNIKDNREISILRYYDKNCSCLNCWNIKQKHMWSKFKRLMKKEIINKNNLEISISQNWKNFVNHLNYKLEKEKEIKRDTNDILLMIKGSLIGSLLILIIYLISLF